MRLFSAEAAALFGVAMAIIFLVQNLRIFEVSALRDQGLGTILSQVVLGMASAALSFLYVCIAIGLARALRNLQQSRELHIIHAGRQIGVLWQAIAIFTLGGALAVLLLAHVIEPAANRQVNQIKAQIAADLVGRSLVPNRFAEMGEGVTVTVGGRRGNGEITEFFADDRRDATRRTYIAKSALITADELGYVLQLRDGTIQYRTADNQFSEIAFARYDIALERLTGETDPGDERFNTGSLTLIAEALESGRWSGETLRRIGERLVQSLRAMALCLFVAAIAGFPTGRRRPPRLPVEITVLVAAFFERALATYAPAPGWLGASTGSLALGAIALVIVVVRLRPRVGPLREARA